MFGLKSDEAQALWQIAIITNTNSSIEGSFNRFYDWATNFNRLEKRKLQLHPSYRRLVDKTSIL